MLKRKIQIYTDSGYVNRDLIILCAYVKIGMVPHSIHHILVNEKLDNNKAELKALIMASDLSVEFNEEPTQIDIFSDSEYALKNIKNKPQNVNYHHCKRRYNEVNPYIHTFAERYRRAFTLGLDVSHAIKMVNTTLFS